MLPPPKDPNFQAPDVSEEQFFDLAAPEDELLLSTGAWDDEPDEGEEADDIDASQQPAADPSKPA
jgi:hypothetical protein